MLARLDAPGRDNDWGRIGDTREYLRRRLPEYQDRLRAFGAIPVDARQPIDDVVDAILSHTLAGPAAGQAGTPSHQPGRPARPRKPPVATPDVVVRDYSPADDSACRMLWVELTEHIADIQDPSTGAEDGSRTTIHLAVPERVASGWPISMTGRRSYRLDRGTSGGSNRSSSLSVSVAEASGGLIERVVTEAVARGYGYLAIRRSPQLRPIKRSTKPGSRPWADTSISRWTLPTGDTAGLKARLWPTWISGTDPGAGRSHGTGIPGLPVAGPAVILLRASSQSGA